LVSSLLLGLGFVCDSCQSSNVPYIQLLACVAGIPTFDSGLPQAALLFNSVACPPGFNVSLAGAGRFLVANPNGFVATNHHGLHVV
jgi:hypothetical protein